LSGDRSLEIELDRAVQAVGLAPLSDGARLELDDSDRPDLSPAFHEASRGAGVYARWVASLGKSSELGQLFLLVSLELPKEARFAIGLGLDRSRRTDALALEMLDGADRLYVRLRSTSAELDFPAPPDPHGVLADAVQWLDGG